MFTYGVLYIFLTMMPVIFREVYQQASGVAGLNYIALGIGMTGASQVFAICSDRLYAKLKQKYGTGKPEYRLCEFSPPTSMSCRTLTHESYQSGLLPLECCSTSWAAHRWVGGRVQSALDLAGYSGYNLGLDPGLHILPNPVAIGHRPSWSRGYSRLPGNSNVYH